jgi:hypothetical protein
MNAHELNREQLTELKQAYMMDTVDAPSYGELAAADELIPDEVIFERYEGTDFVEEDFRSEMPWDYGKHFN